MRSTILLSCLLSTLISQFSAQNISFSTVYLPLPVPQIRAEMRPAVESEMADLNGDGALDIVLYEYHFGSRSSTFLYWNDGSGNFSEDTTGLFDTLDISNYQLIDFDADGDTDIYTTSFNQSDKRRFEIFENDGSGSFSLKAGPAPGGDIPSWGMADLDGDGAPELLAMVEVTQDSSSAFLYQNDGNGGFTEIPSGPIIPQTPYFNGRGNGFRVEFADIDNSGSLDLLTSGEHFGSTSKSTKLYLNDGSAQFSRDTNNALAKGDGPVVFSDMNGDGSQDLIIEVRPNLTTLLYHYQNDGSGNFTRKTSSVLDDFEYVTHIEVADVDGDGALDLLISGSYQSSSAFYILLNDGQGNWSLSNTQLRRGGAEAGDLNGDGAIDMVITGGSPHRSKVYINDGSGGFNRASDSYFEPAYQGKTEFIDYDNDGDADLLSSGYGQDAVPKLIFYLNDGNGNFTKDSRNSFDGVESSDFDFADIDADSDVDLLVNGSWEGGVAMGTRLFINDGTGVFTEDTTTNFYMTREGTVEFADINGDGDQDVIVTGVTSGSIGIHVGGAIYENNGLGQFFLHTSISGGIKDGDVVFADVDGDGDQDIIYSGEDRYGDYECRLFTNDGIGNYNFNGGAKMNFTGLTRSSLLLTDLDADGDPDLVISGQREDNTALTKLFENDGGGNFSEVVGQNLQDVYWGNVEAIDVNDDGLPELLITGTNIGDRYTTLYYNKGGLDFQPVGGLPFDQVYRGSTTTADVDGDQDEDILLTGVNQIGIPVAKMYHNDYYTVSIAEQSELLEGVDLYPNPTSGTVNVQWSGLEKVEVTIYDTQGQVLSSEVVRNQKELEIALPQTTGLFIVEISAQGQTGIWKVIKKP